MFNKKWRQQENNNNEWMEWNEKQMKELTASHCARNHGERASALFLRKLLINWGSWATIQKQTEEMPTRKAMASQDVYTQSPNHLSINMFASAPQDKYPCDDIIFNGALGRTLCIRKYPNPKL